MIWGVDIRLGIHPQAARLVASTRLRGRFTAKMGMRSGRFGGARPRRINPERKRALARARRLLTVPTGQPSRRRRLFVTRSFDVTEDHRGLKVIRQLAQLLGENRSDVGQLDDVCRRVGRRPIDSIEAGVLANPAMSWCSRVHVPPPAWPRHRASGRVTPPHGSTQLAEPERETSPETRPRRRADRRGCAGRHPGPSAHGARRTWQMRARRPHPGGRQTDPEVAGPTVLGAIRP